MIASALKGPGEVVAEILMTRQVFAGSLLIVEGDDDSRFFRPRVLPKQCEIVIAGGKPAVSGGITRLDALSFRGALGVVDDDCDSLDGSILPSRNMVCTDARDLEALLLRTGAFYKVLAEYGDPSSIRAFESMEGVTVRDALVRRALPFGQLRWHAKRTGAPVAFTKLPPNRFADENRWIFDENALLAAACAQGLASSPAALRQDLAALPAADPWLVCHGHDLVEILSIGLRKVLGRGKPGRERVASTLRAGADASDLDATRLWSAIRDWALGNPPYRVL